MQRLTSWIFTFVASVLLVYACVRYGHVRGEIAVARTRLEALRTAAARLEEDNSFLSYQIGRLDSLPAPDSRDGDAKRAN